MNQLINCPHSGKEGNRRATAMTVTVAGGQDTAGIDATATAGYRGQCWDDAVSPESRAPGIPAPGAVRLRARK
jgi:hypothetical protein